MPQPLKLYWWRESPAQRNFGDELSPLIVEALLGNKVVWCRESPKLLAVGSILIRAGDDDVVWGSGCFTAEDFISAKQLTILAVRGPLTREVLLKRGMACPANYGDPACLITKLFPRQQTTAHYEIGILPHWCDREIVQERFGGLDNIRIIDPFSPPAQVIAELTNCRILLSSSLHGLIAADAYGIPARYVRFRNQPAGFYRLQGRDHFKFFDYFLTVGRELTHPALLLDRSDLQRSARQATCASLQIDHRLLTEKLVTHFEEYSRVANYS
jgi:pyruvyltransferase